MQTSLSYGVVIQKKEYGIHKKPVTTVTPVNTATNQIQYISTTDSSSPSINRFSTGLLHPQWSPPTNIPCTTGIRMPNLTDCKRYYTCNSTYGIIFAYTCPPQTAFNVYTHVCDTSIYKWCERQTGTYNQPFIPPSPTTVISLTTPLPTSCSKPGKTPDPQSSKHYFVCYFQRDRIKKYRMACPNTLHYCASQRVCKKPSDCSG
ncbi:probable endochitinase [Cryptotermes secundus]|uniref:probable endochitinase n=1 Tax=Cryptotermes secundus TaxID=105785 RepID=UPI001454C3BF|nr:probable endochitinase [Cryptotermes secundus]